MNRSQVDRLKLAVQESPINHPVGVIYFKAGMAAMLAFCATGSEFKEELDKFAKQYTDRMFE